jgi:uncharacterized membrane protein
VWSRAGEDSAKALVGIGVAGPRVDPFGQPLLGSEPVEQREELLALGGLEAATELLLVLEGDLHDLAEQPPALLCEVQGPHATIAGAGLSHEQAALLEDVDEGHHPARRDLQCVAQRLLGPAFVAGQAAEHHDVARVKIKGRQPSLPTDLFKFLHILAVIVWVGGVLTVNVLQLLTGRGHDRAAQASLLRLSDLYGRAVIAPAAALTLVTGLVRVEQIDVGYGTFWVAWGIAAIILSLALGATLIRATNAELRRVAADAPADDQRWATLRRRATTLFGINLLLLLSAVWAMEFKPTL